MSVHPTQLFALLLENKQYQKLSSLLEQTEGLLHKEGQQDLWLYWKAQALMASEHPEQALALISRITGQNEAKAIEIQALKAIAHGGRDTARLEQRLEFYYRSHGDALCLFELCEIKGIRGDWQFVADHADDLINLISTHAALRLAVYGVYNSGQAKRCLDLLSKNVELFPNLQLPIDLKRIRISCQQQLGLLMQAARNAELVASESGDYMDKSNLITLKLACGDPKAASLIARDFLLRSDVPEENLLRAAHLLHTEDLSLAQDLLSQAVKTGRRTPELVAVEIDLAFKLNRQDVLPALLPEMLKSVEAGVGPMKGLSLQELNAILQRNRSQLVQESLKYQRGCLPIHYVASRQGQSIASVIHRSFHPDVADQSLPPGMMILFGGRPMGVPKERIERLYIDITALLLADHLDLLETIEIAYGTLFFPPSINQVIAFQLQQASHQQPARLLSQELIVNYCANGKIRVFSSNKTLFHRDTAADTQKQLLGAEWFATLKHVKSNAGLLVEFLPLKRGSTLADVILENDEAKFVVGVGSLLSSLESAGKLSLRDAQLAHQHIDPLALHESILTFSIGSRIYLTCASVEALAVASILPQVCSNFETYLEESDLAAIQNEVNLERGREHLRCSLKHLQEKLRRGLLSGKYQMIDNISDQAEMQRSNLTETEAITLPELLCAARVPGAYVWVDDRFLNAHLAFGALPIITIADILLDLKSKNAISTKLYYEKLNRLRSGNFRFIPFEKSELLHHLSNATVTTGKIVETPELSTLRRHIASCILERMVQGPQLDVADQATQSQLLAEFEVVINILMVARQVLAEIWRDEHCDNETLTARCDWVLENIWFNMAALPLLAKKPLESEQVRNMLGSDVSCLFGQGISLPNKRLWARSDLEAPRLRYIDWLQTRVPFSNESVNLMARHLRAFFDNRREDKTLAPEQFQIQRVILGEFLGELPQKLQRSLGLSSQALHSLGIKHFEAIQISQWLFDARSFWNAIERAVQRGRSKLYAKRQPQEFNLTFQRQGEELSIVFEAKVPGESFRLVDPLFSALVRDESERTANLFSLYGIFDMPRKTFAEKASRLAQNQNGAERMIQLELLRRGSASDFYNNLQGKVQRNGKAEASDFAPPPIDCILQHLHLPSLIENGNLMEPLEDACSSLLNKHGFIESFRRLASLPLKLPESIGRAYTSLSENERRQFKTEFGSICSSPISKIHLLTVILSPADASDSFSMSTEIINGLFSDDGKNSFLAFKYILQWTLARIQGTERAEYFSNASILTASWAHATRLHNILSPTNTQNKIAEYFENLYRPQPCDAFGADPSLLGDVAHPRILRRTTLLASGVMNAVAGHNLMEVCQSLPKLMRDLCFINSEFGLVPILEFLVSPTTLFNNTGSFIAQPRSKLFEPALGADARILGQDELDSQIESSLAILMNNPKDIQHWILLKAFQGPLGFHGNNQSRVSELLYKISFVDFIEFDLNALRLVLFLITNHAKLINDIKLSDKIKVELLILTRLFADDRGNESLMTQRVEILLESIHYLTDTNVPPTNAVSTFGDIVTELVYLWPASAGCVWSFVKRLVFLLPERTSIALWPLVLNLRKLAN